MNKNPSDTNKNIEKNLIYDLVNLFYFIFFALFFNSILFKNPSDSGFKIDNNVQILTVTFRVYIRC